MTTLSRWLSQQEQHCLTPTSKHNLYRLWTYALPKQRYISLDLLTNCYLLSLPENMQIDAALRQYLQSLSHPVFVKTLSQHNKQSPQLLYGKAPLLSFTGQEHGVSYKINLAAGYSQGIFLDQRENKLRIQQLPLAGKKILNTFAYTGGFSLAAAKAGAITTTLDISAPFLQWSKQNFILNKHALEQHYFCKGSTQKWLHIFAKKQRTFDGIILDPPSFSRYDNKVFQIKKDYPKLLQQALRCIDTGWILACCNTYAISFAEFRDLIQQTLQRSERQTQCCSYRMPAEFAPANYLKTIWIDIKR